MGFESKFSPELQTLNELFIGFQTGGASNENAQELLGSIYKDDESKSRLHKLLIAYCDNKIVFYPLIENPIYQGLLIDLCMINKAIITLPLDHEQPDISLLSFIIDKQPDYDVLFTWIKNTHPKLVALERSCFESVITPIESLKHEASQSMIDDVFLTCFEELEVAELNFEETAKEPTRLPTSNTRQPATDFSREPLQEESPLSDILRPDEFINAFAPIINRLQPVNYQALNWLIDTGYQDNSILDAFLHQTLFKALATKHIALMPTVNDKQAIEFERLISVTTGEFIDYTSDIKITDKTIHPLITSKQIDSMIGYFAWVININNNHYGVLFLYFDAVEPKGYYFEPLRTESISREDLLPYLTSITSKLPIDIRNIEIIHFSQTSEETCCADYTIALLTRLAYDDFDFHDPESIRSLNGQHIDDMMIRRIRMLQVQLFGPDYFLYQLPEYSQHILTPKEKKTIIYKIFTALPSIEALQTLERSHCNSPEDSEYEQPIEIEGENIKRRKIHIEALSPEEAQFLAAGPAQIQQISQALKTIQLFFSPARPHLEAAEPKLRATNCSPI